MTPRTHATCNLAWSMCYFLFVDICSSHETESKLNGSTIVYVVNSFIRCIFRDVHGRSHLLTKNGFKIRQNTLITFIRNYQVIKFHFLWKC